MTPGRCCCTCARRTPILMEVGGSEWMRIHPLAREFLLRRFERLPAHERQDLSERASRWLADHQMYEEAAQLALSAGQVPLAYDLAERCMYELILRGQMGRVLEWLERLPETEVTQRPRLRLAAAWALALGGHHDKARGLAAHIHADPGRGPGRPLRECGGVHRRCLLFRSGRRSGGRCSPTGRCGRRPARPSCNASWPTSRRRSACIGANRNRRAISS